MALPWIPVAAAIIGVTLGFVLSRIPAGRDRKRKATGFLRGIESEIDYAINHAREYVEGKDGKRVFGASLPAANAFQRLMVQRG